MGGRFGRCSGEIVGSAYPEGIAMRYAILLEPTKTGFSAHVPDLPGCVAAGRTREDTLELIREAIGFHLEGMRLHGEPITGPTSICGHVEVTQPLETPRG